ncbi:hypothetical protein [Sphingomonas sp. LK11]|jgi:hypothetical protein|uniref:hypothetical protein n=1 Tax=Sphingomonas sp. LK11 TaxID=1390395 RepID=UPI0012EB3C45|nr:hypothetical protein [Sphingomonas sp. LK11]
MAPIYGNSYSAQAQVTYGIYIYNGSWVRVGGGTAFMYGSGYNSGGYKYLTTQEQITITYNGDFSDLRVVLESTDEGDNGAINSVPNATWTSQTNSGQRSATPNGEQVLATMRPS